MRSGPPDPDLTLRRQARREAVRELAALAPGTAAWGLVTGVAMVKTGLPLWAALVMSFTMYAGSAQLAVLPLLAAQSPLWVTVATAFCVNLRFVIYSAQWRPFFMHLRLPRRLLLGYVTTDMGYALFMKRHPEPPQGVAERDAMISYFEAGAAVNWSVWQAASVLGILAADRVPTEWGLGFAGVLALLALTYASIRDGRALAAALVAAAAAVAAYGLPYRLNIVVAIVAAVAVGLWMDGRGGTPRRWREALARMGSASPPKGLQRGGA